MNRRCTDPVIGQLLSGYELDMLSESEQESFEIHLMACDHCRKSVEEFQPQMDILRRDSDIVDILAPSKHQRPRAETAWSRLVRTLWISPPRILRPAALLPAILLLIVAVYLQNQDGPGTGDGPVEVRSLFQGRGPETILEVSPDHSLVLSVACRFGVPGEQYDLSLKATNGRIVYHEPAFRDVDSQGILNILLVDGLDEGDYVLTVKGQDHQTQEFKFTVVHD